jgi:hypothetical protein
VTRPNHDPLESTNMDGATPLCEIIYSARGDLELVSAKFCETHPSGPNNKTELVIFAATPGALGKNWSSVTPMKVRKSPSSGVDR